MKTLLKIWVPVVVLVVVWAGFAFLMDAARGWGDCKTQVPFLGSCFDTRANMVVEQGVAVCRCPPFAAPSGSTP